jgi:CubicO group peptidase (beta-lactamase class C family)
MPFGVEAFADSQMQPNSLLIGRGAGRRNSVKARLTLWLALMLAVANLRAAAPAVESFEPVDEAVQRFMGEHDVHAATLAISREGKLLHERAFGFADRELKTPLTPGVRMRLASVSKPITAAALRYLVRDGKLKLGDPVMKFLPAPRFPEPSDLRWKAITIGEVLEHKGGWDRSLAGDPMFKHREIMKDLNTTSLGPKEVVCWMLRQPLQFEPGSRSTYSNFGYCLLGVIMEQVQELPYGAYVKSTVGKEAAMTSLSFSSTNPRLRPPDETWYDFGSEGEHFLIEPMEAHGGWVCTAADLTRFLDKFWINGQPRHGGKGNWAFFGSLPGTTSVAVQRPDGFNCVLLMNKRGSGDWPAQARTLLDAALTSSSSGTNGSSRAVGGGSPAGKAR